MHTCTRTQHTDPHARVGCGRKERVSEEGAKAAGETRQCHRRERDPGSRSRTSVSLELQVTSLATCTLTHTHPDTQL